MTITLFIILLTGIASLAALNNQNFMEQWVFKPFLINHNRREWYRFFTCGLLHADYMHLFINMFVLYSFGTRVERLYFLAFGTLAPYYFITLYVTSIAFANIMTYYKERNNPAYSALGASGAVSAILFTSILFLPFDKVCLYKDLCYPGVALGLIYLVYSYIMSRQKQGIVNHDAHFYGAIYGILFTIACRPKTASDFYIQLMNWFN